MHTCICNVYMCACSYVHGCAYVGIHICTQKSEENILCPSSGAALIFVVKTVSLTGLGKAGWRNPCRGGNLMFAQHGSFFLPLSLPSSDSTSSSTFTRNFQTSWLATSPLAALVARCPHYPRPVTVNFASVLSFNQMPTILRRAGTKFSLATGSTTTIAVANSQWRLGKCLLEDLEIDVVKVAVFKAFPFGSPEHGASRVEGITFLEHFPSLLFSR